MFTPSRFNSLNFILILSSHLRVSYSNVFQLSSCSTKISYAFFISTIRRADVPDQWRSVRLKPVFLDHKIAGTSEKRNLKPSNSFYKEEKKFHLAKLLLLIRTHCLIFSFQFRQLKNNRVQCIYFVFYPHSTWKRCLTSWEFRCLILLAKLQGYYGTFITSFLLPTELLSLLGTSPFRLFRIRNYS